MYHNSSSVLIREERSLLEIKVKELEAEIHYLTLRLEIADPDGETIGMTHDDDGNEIQYS